MDFFKTFFSNALSGVSNLLVYIAIVALFAAGLIRCIAPVMHTRARCGAPSAASARPATPSTPGRRTTFWARARCFPTGANT